MTPRSTTTRAERGETVGNAMPSESLTDARTAARGRKTTTDSTPRAAEPSTGLREHWELWFPARLGPIRTKTRNGVRVKVQRLELPPTLNDRLHHHVKAPWVKQWRHAAYFLAKGRELPRVERARISAVIYRDRLGVADPDNDIGRLKPLLDGLRDAGALAKDTHRHIQFGSIEERRGDQGILLIVEEIAPARPPGGSAEGSE